MSDQLMTDAAEEALRKLSEYLPLKHQSAKANDVYLLVAAAFKSQQADFVRRLAATAEERDSWKDGAETLAMQVKDLQREVDQWVKNSSVSQRRIEALEAALATRRSACDEESDRADKAERQLKKAQTALENIARECSSFPIRGDLAFRCESLARAALPDTQKAKSPPG